MEIYGKGALASEQILSLMEEGAITDAKSEHVSPASLDLSLSEEMYQIEGLVLPKSGESVRTALSYMGTQTHSITKPLTAGKLYIVRLNEAVHLPADIYGYCNPKSSTGRLDMHVRVLADGVPRYDSLTPKGYQGELWLAIYPQSFSIQVHHGTPLTQLRLFNQDTRLLENELESAHKKYELIWHSNEERSLEYTECLTNDQDGALLLTAYVEDTCAGYECVADPHSLVDVSRVGQYNAQDFFAPIQAVDGMLHLKRDKFYILSGAERVRIPPTLASEMVPMDERSGDFRSHYAGFLDPGWGWGTDGEDHGRPFTLEVRPFENLRIREGQPIAKIRFERMAHEPSIHYDTKASNYLSQTGPKLAKQFYIE